MFPSGSKSGIDAELIEIPSYTPAYEIKKEQTNVSSLTTMSTMRPNWTNSSSKTSVVVFDSRFCTYSIVQMHARPLYLAAAIADYPDSTNACCLQICARRALGMIEYCRKRRDSFQRGNAAASVRPRHLQTQLCSHLFYREPLSSSQPASLAHRKGRHRSCLLAVSGLALPLLHAHSART